MGVVQILPHLIPEAAFAELLGVGEKEHSLVSILELYGVPLWQLIQQLELEPKYHRGDFVLNGDKFQTAVKFANIYLRARSVLRRHGWDLCRAGYGPQAEFWIERAE